MIENDSKKRKKIESILKEILYIRFNSILNGRFAPSGNPTIGQIRQTDPLQ